MSYLVFSLYKSWEGGRRSKSIGCVNPELYALASGTWNLEGSEGGVCQNKSNMEEWMQNYANVLCINSWQVKRYINVYSASSVIGFSNEDLLHVSETYAQAAENWSHTVMNLALHKNESCNLSLHDLRRQIDAYFSFLASVAELARSKWTEFNLKMMGTGFGMMLISLLVHFIAIRKLDKLFGVYFVSYANSGFSFGLTFSCLIVAICACSFLSNSYILEEGKVASFLAATTGMLNLRYSIIKKKMLLEAVAFVLLISILRFSIELGLSKLAVSSILLDICLSWMLGTAKDSPFWMHIAEFVPVLALIILTFMLHESCCIMRLESLDQDSKNVTIGTVTLYSSPVTQWSLLAVCLFFCTGHWCAFDGLRYAAAFIGFDEFILIPQAILLSIDTFGFSHILPIFGLPFLVARRLPFGQDEQRKRFFFMQLSQVYLMYGLVTATTVTFTILCVTIQRRHLMVWGLFAPKFVFDVVGLVLSDVLICLAFLYYYGSSGG